jgi:tripartite-type tricarboxylate transporter receptor subunit TctC
MSKRSLLTRRAVLRAGGAFAIGATALARSARAAGYPDHPVRIIAPFAAGGPSDTLSRLLSVRLGEKLGGFFYVENHPGAGSNIGTSVAGGGELDG